MLETFLLDTLFWTGIFKLQKNIIKSNEVKVKFKKNPVKRDFFKDIL